MFLNEQQPTTYHLDASSIQLLRRVPAPSDWAEVCTFHMHIAAAHVMRYHNHLSDSCSLGSSLDAALRAPVAIGPADIFSIRLSALWGLFCDCSVAVCIADWYRPAYRSECDKPEALVDPIVRPGFRSLAIDFSAYNPTQPASQVIIARTLNVRVILQQWRGRWED